MKIVCIGDSLTYGYGINIDHRWSEILKKTYNYNVINKGINGNTTTDIMVRYYDDVIQSKATHVIIMAGTNDFFMNTPPYRVFDNIVEIIEDTKNNNITPIISIPPMIIPIMANELWSEYIDYNQINIQIEEYRNLLYEYCKKNNIRLIDFYDVFNKIVRKDGYEKYYIDGIHPTLIGHTIIANKIIYEKNLQTII